MLFHKTLVCDLLLCYGPLAAAFMKVLLTVITLPYFSQLLTSVSMMSQWLDAVGGRSAC